MALPAYYAEIDTYTEDQYLELEDAALHKSEWVDGEIRAMAGASDNHNLVAANFVRTLGNALVPKGCRVYGSDFKVHVGDGMNTYPDALVVCGPRDYYKGRTSIITNPLVIVEVLSPSTEAWDRGGKWERYQTVPSLQDYVLAAQDKPDVWHYSRDGDGWRFTRAQGLESTVTLPSVGTTLALSELYALAEFDAA